MANCAVEEPLSDARERELAATTFDRNVVVTAGAGTGKTTLLVDRLTHLLMREPDPLALTQIVALTFTNKAAHEMKARLRQRLQSYLSARLDDEARTSEHAKTAQELKSLIRLYHLRKDEINRRAREALRQIERSYISTIHSFAALLLRLHPLESGIDPQFQEDDGTQFKRAFEERWAVWLDDELGRGARHHAGWRLILTKLSLERVREIAFSLSSEMIPLEQLGVGRKTPPRLLRHWLKECSEEITKLIEIYPEERHHIDGFARRTGAILEAASKFGYIPARELEETTRWVAGKTLRPAGAWSTEDYQKLRRLWRIARGLFLVDPELTESIWELLIPFARDFRRRFAAQGYISFDGLLVRARDLLRDHPALRDELKQSFKAILIDEFQDTDPIQYEILLYLAEQRGQNAADWQSVRLQPGKIFVVGDPKQSIYAFRRADIQGYLDVVKKIILAQNGVECPLRTNFRSHARILNTVNGMFAALIREREALQPDYVPIEAPRPNDDEPGAAQAFRRISFCRIESDKPLNSQAARRLEAEHLARWLREEVLGKAQILDARGEPVVVEPRHVAFLFRKLTDVHLYLEPLRRSEIPYVVEGEKHFYATQEIVDAVNLLRAVSNPDDHSALVALLRSPIGGLSDLEIYELSRSRLLDYRTATRHDARSTAKGDALCSLYRSLERLHRETRTLSVADAVHHIFATIPVRILAARSFNGEQAVANIEKMRQQAVVMSRSGAATLKEVAARLERRVVEVEEEGESMLAEETLNAVKILSVHKAKGLEFPVVVLPDSRGAPGARALDAGVQYDWSSNLIGLSAGEHLNLEAVYLEEKRRLREEEEQKRVFYVAMTRAREHVRISSPPLRIDRGSFVDLLQSSVGQRAVFIRSGFLALGAGRIDVNTVCERPEPPRPLKDKTPKSSTTADWTRFARQWKERDQAYQIAQNRTLFVSPTALGPSPLPSPRGGGNSEEIAPKGRGKFAVISPREIGEIATSHLESRVKIETGLIVGGEREKDGAAAADALVAGTLAHGFLEKLDFSADRDTFDDELARYLEQQPERLFGGRRAEITKDLRQMFSDFFGSRAFAELSAATILGREIPFLLPVGNQVMEGVIDLIYECQGLLYVADYKTDRVASNRWGKIREHYQRQAAIYSYAVRKALKTDLRAFKLFFLRSGRAIELKTDERQRELFFDHENPFF